MIDQATQCCVRRGTSLVEVAMASLLVSVLLIGALNTVGARLRHQSALTDRHRACLLAEQLLSEVLQHRYQDPDETPVFGPEASESAGSRADFDDIDDFHTWDATPPQATDGTPLANSAGWRRTITVEYVSASDVTTTAASDEGLKRITVEVYKDGQLICSRVALRSSAWEDASASY
jgi:Tfp pilus assembly protein PilV